MDKLIKNIEHKTVLKIKDEVTYQKGQIVSKTLSQNEHHSLTLLHLTRVKKSALTNPAVTL